MKKWLFCLLVGLSIFFVGCAGAKPKVQLSQIQIR